MDSPSINIASDSDKILTIVSHFVLVDAKFYLLRIAYIGPSIIKPEHHARKTYVSMPFIGKLIIRTEKTSTSLSGMRLGIASKEL